MSKLKLKIITGYRDDQSHTIDAEEAHKAYYLFLNPTERGVFAGGIAIRGQDIQQITPDYNATMGWNNLHRLDEYDMKEIRKDGIDKEIRQIMGTAKSIAEKNDPKLLSLPLSEASPKELGQAQGALNTENYADYL